jgi:AcrR family transcriptional regulator
LARDAPDPRQRRQRADAALNRKAILSHAYDVLTSGQEWSLNSIARGSGVANATLYRHFADREALILAVYEMELDRVTNAADQLLEDLPADEALEAWVAELAHYAMTKNGFADALRAATAPGSERYSDTYDRIVASLATLLDAAADAGAVRPGLNPDDVILAFAGLWQLDPTSDWQASAQRLYQLVLGGLAP